MSPRIGFIGFGEAGFAMAKGLKAAGAATLFAYDTALDKPGMAGRIRSCAAEASVTLAHSLGDLAERCDIIFSAVVANAAADVAKEIARYLDRRHLYVDLNSTSPAIKQAIGRIVEASGAAFVEAAVMDAVPPNGHRVPMLLCGKGATRFVEAMAPFGMRLEMLGEAIGPASATKMFRSIIVKGLEALILESLMGAQHFDVEARVFASVAESFPGLDWDGIANYLVGRTALHGERRAHEMTEVADTLRGLGIEPIMADAAARRIASTLPYKLRERFAGKAPKHYAEVVAAFREPPKI